jgi:hypothetical protein
VIAGATILSIGLILIWSGFSHWRFRNQETISILEAKILDIAEEEPLPLSKLDWLLKYTQIVLGLTLGPLLLLAGIAVIMNEMELL